MNRSSGKKREGEKEETYYDVVPLISQQQPQQHQQHCFSCGVVIRLKKADNSGWIRLNLDNTIEHQCIKKKKKQQPLTVIIG
jgi:hypothetical protein